MPTIKEIKYPSLLANLFSSSFTQRVIADTHIPYLVGILEQTGFKKQIRADYTVKTILSKIFYYLNEHYRCEYIYKTAILNEVLLKHHTLLEASYLTEFRSFNAKADIVIVNGTSIVYEIKSDIDRLDRLCSQTTAYQQIFDKVVIVSNQENISKIKEIVPPNIGIISLHPNMHIEMFREATSNVPLLNKELLFDCLRKPEYLSIIQTAFGKIPSVPSTRIHSACKRLFTTLSNEEAHAQFTTVLKQRQFSKEQINLVNKVDKVLKCLLADKIYSTKACKLIKFGLDQKLIN